MSQLVLFVILGLGTGSIYALAALGLVLVYRGSGVINFANGAIGMVGTYVFWQLNQQQGWPFAPALLVGCLVGAAIGALTHLLVMRPLRRASVLVRLIGTVGVLTILQGAMSLKYPQQVIAVPSFLPTSTISVLGAVVGLDRVVILGVCVVGCALLFAVYRWTRFGLQTAAVAENPQVAAALGHSPDVIAVANWALGSALAALAGCLLAPITGLQVTAMTLLVVPALAAAVVGNLRSFPITVATGLGIGVVQSLLSRYWNFTGGQTAVPFILIIVVLTVRGSRIPPRGVTGIRLPRVGTGTVRPVPLAIAVVLALAILLFGTQSYVAAATVSMAVATMLLSIVVLTGYAGQLSLAQFAIAGLGAWVAGRLVAAAGLSFGAASLVAVLAMVPTGIILGLPALRARGENLAVATLGIAVAVEAVIFDAGSLTGGFLGTSVGSIKLLGISLDPILHPRTYAVFTLACFAVLTLMVANLRRGRSGRRLLAVRANERAAAALGIDTTRAKVFAFVLASCIAAVGGILYAFQYPVITYSSFTSFTSITLVGLAVIGGLGYLNGPVIGACLFAGGLGTAVINLFGQGIQRYLPLISGIILGLNLLQTPDGSGLAPSITSWITRLTARLSRARVRRTGTRGSGLVPAPGGTHNAARATGRELRVRDLTVRYGGVLAVDGLSLSVRPGQVVGLIGPNGAGKTTVLDAITGFIRPSAGTVTLDDTDLSHLRTDQRSAAGVARSFQALELFEDMTVRENLLVAVDPQDWTAYVKDLIGPRAPRLTPGAVSAVEEFDLLERLDVLPTELSYGQRRLVAVARAVAAEPAVLLLDEPAAGLDAGSRTELGHLIRRLAEVRGIGVLLIEHDVELVMSVCDHVVVLDFGCSIASGSPAEVRSDERVITAYVGASAQGPAVPVPPSPGGIGD